jgi:hypothetical protein
MCLHSKGKKEKKIENKSLTNHPNSTFLKELESSSRSCDHYHLVHQIVAEVGTVVVVVVDNIEVGVEQS